MSIVVTMVIMVTNTMTIMTHKGKTVLLILDEGMMGGRLEFFSPEIHPKSGSDLLQMLTVNLGGRVIPLFGQTDDEKKDV